ncbi:MAG: DUF1573 domain-containing protein [Chitinophagales bacterium]|nr:DUF1573 domain-containing protein [Chitinophagales bacterium]MDW8394248.1 DUF1573 domain-containing protein [Chitinophagales bacterium]
MKKNLLVIGLFLAVSLTVEAQNQPAATQPTQAITPTATGANNPNAGEFKFQEETYDFGKIPKGIPVTHDFTFTNVGKEPIIISNVQASCGCTTPSWPKEPILPGKTGAIKVQYNAASPGSFNKSITIMSNSKTPTKVLYVKGTVEAQVEQTTPERAPNMLSTPNN